MNFLYKTVEYKAVKKFTESLRPIIKCIDLNTCDCYVYNESNGTWFFEHNIINCDWFQSLINNSAILTILNNTMNSESNEELYLEVLRYMYDYNFINKLNVDTELVHTTDGIFNKTTRKTVPHSPLNYITSDKITNMSIYMYRICEGMNVFHFSE